MSSSSTKTWRLQRNGELRIDVGLSNKLEILLTEGDAEIFGCEIIPDKKITLDRGYCCSVHSWTGAVLITRKIQIDCDENAEELSEVVYSTSSPETMIFVAQESPALQYLNLHYFIKSLRDRSFNDGLMGPRVLICGPCDTGKSTLCQVLLNYAVRNGNQCLYVDLDPGQNNLSIPGTISASYIDKLVTDLVDSAYLKDSSCISEKFSRAETPFTYFLGGLSLDECYDNYLNYIHLLSKAVYSRALSSNKLKKSGFIINSCGYITGKGLGALNYIIESFNVNVIVVLENEKLHTQLKGYESKDIHTILLPKSNGVVERSKMYRRYCREKAFKSYFYGLDGNFAPEIIDISFNDIKVFTISPINLLESCLPVGFKNTDENGVSFKLHARLVNIDETIINHVLAVVHAENDSDVCEAVTLGFVVPLKVDSTSKTVKLLCPSPGLPSKYLVYSCSLKYPLSVTL